ncbi:MAG: type II toxin-antitoxin system RelE/ParE family toxin [Alphaproteobacteria bacterium]
MASRVVLTAPADRDLAAIFEYLATEASLSIADLVMARLLEAMGRAALFPRLYQERLEFTGRPRRINVYSYAIFYDLLPSGDVRILRVLHGRLDLDRYLGPDNEQREAA